MTSKDKTLCVIYGVLAFGALLGTWSENILFIQESGSLSVLAFLEACFANHAAASVTIDIIILTVAAFVFMGVEAKRLGIRHVWIYMVLSVLIAISVMFPLFLIARQRRVSAV